MGEKSEQFDQRITVKDYAKTLPFYKRIPLNVRRWMYGEDTVYRELLKTRGKIDVFSTKGKVMIPEHNYTMLMELSKKNWLLRQIFRSIIGEVINSRWTIEPRFKSKCKKCGQEYDNAEVKECEICGGKYFSKPEYEQYMIIKKLIDEPFEGRNFTEFVRSSLWYDIALDNAYWETVYTYTSRSKEPTGFRVLNAATIYPLMNQYGVLGSDEYFCPMCYNKDQAIGVDTYYKLNDTKIDPTYGTTTSVATSQRCPKCGGKLAETAYKQIANNKVTARWSKDEITYLTSGRLDPETFGSSKILACLKHLYTLMYMDEYNFQIYGHGHLTGFMLFPGLDQTEVSGMKQEIETELTSKDKIDTYTGELTKNLEVATVFVGIEEGKEPKYITVDIPLDKMHSIDFYRLYVEKVSGVFGVTPIFTSTTNETGMTGGRLEIDVQNRVTKGYISDLEDAFNEQLLPKFKVTDWIIRFGKIESKDELRDAQIRLTNSQAVSILLGAGFEVEAKEDMRGYTVSIKPENRDKEKEPKDQSRLESGRLPQNLDGTATRTMATGTEQGVPIEEPIVSERQEDKQ